MIKKIIHLTSAIVLASGMLSACSSMDSTHSASAADVIAEAKQVTAQARAANYEWRDTGKLIKQAEKKLQAGDEAGALKLASQALEQSRIALRQAKIEAEKFAQNN